MKIFFDTLGCPKNSNDTEVAAGLLEEKGFDIVDDPVSCDVIIINTCGFINDAKRESIDHIFNGIEFKKMGKKVVVSGCLPQRFAKDLFEEIPEVDLFIGVNEYHKLPELLKDLGNRKFETSECTCKHLPLEKRKLNDNPYSSTIKISEGCDNYCTYCVIPSIRGHFRSKKLEDVVCEAKNLASKGCKELILIGEDVTQYGVDLYGEKKLAALLKELCKIPKIKWIRLMYCYEDKIDDELIDIMSKEDKICNYIDIPIQHSSDKVLESMNRHSTQKSIAKTLAKLRDRMPDIAIRTTLIVGFPGETNDDFESLVEFIERQKFQRLGAFAYSQEENTVAGQMENQVSEEVKLQRLDQVMRRQIDISLEHNRSLIGKILEVLVEGQDEEGCYIGRTQYDAPEIDNNVIFTTNNVLKPGDFVMVKITDAFDYDLIGQEI